MKILVNSFIRKIDRIGIIKSRKSCAQSLSAVSKFRRAERLEIALEDKDATLRQRIKESRHLVRGVELKRRKSFDINLFNMAL